MGEQAITCIVENGNIYKLEFGQKICIGVTAEIFTNLKTNAEKALERNEELAKERDKYYNMLIEHGIITKPKSAEDRIEELEKSNKNIVLTNEKILLLLENINSALNKNEKRLEALENGYSINVKNGNSTGDRTGQDKSSNADGK